jgi:hypothetical protein
MKLPIVWLSFLTACFCCSLGPRFGEAGGYPWPSAAGEGDSGDVDTELRLAPLRPHPAAEHKAPSGHQASDEKGKQPETRDFLEVFKTIIFY